MSIIRIFAVLLVAATAAACATPYREGDPVVEFLTTPGGYRNIEVSSGVWHVTYRANANTTSETLQTYWLYRCAELALEKGYDGFEIMSGPPLAALPARHGRGSSLVQRTAGHSAPIFIPMYSGPAPPIFTREGDIRLLHNPLTPVAGKTFDAAKLKATLEPYVKGKKCDEQNVCTHEHRYLHEPAEGSDKGA